MSDNEEDDLTPEPDLAIRYYQFIACAGLLVLGLALFELAATFALLPVIIGAMGVIPSLLPPETRGGRIVRRIPVHLMPPLVLMSVAIVEILFGYSLINGHEYFAVSDLLTAVGLLMYLAGQYRLFGLSAEAVPRDLRPRPDRNEGDEPETWPPSLPDLGGLKWLAIVIAVTVLAGQFGWHWIVSGDDFRKFEGLSRERQPLARLLLRRTGDLEPHEPWERGSPATTEPRSIHHRQYDLDVGAWRFVSLVWLLGVGTIVLVSFAGTLRIYRMTVDEARMIGQDILWTEMRGEQRSIARWLAWSRRKWFRKAGQQP
jgi:hypothetical protein